MVKSSPLYAEGEPGRQDVKSTVELLVRRSRRPSGYLAGNSVPAGLKKGDAGGVRRLNLLNVTAAVLAIVASVLAIVDICLRWPKKDT